MDSVALTLMVPVRPVMLPVRVWVPEGHVETYTAAETVQASRGVRVERMEDFDHYTTQLMQSGMAYTSENEITELVERLTASTPDNLAACEFISARIHRILK